MSRKSPPLKISEITYRKNTPEEEEVYIRKMQELMATVIWEYNNGLYENDSTSNTLT